MRRPIDIVPVARLEAVEPARSTDPINGWFPTNIAAPLRQVGAVTLADLQGRIERGGRWWLSLKAFGPVKAARLAGYLRALLPATPAVGWPVAAVDASLAGFSGVNALNRVVGAYAGTEARDDA